MAFQEKARSFWSSLGFFSDDQETEEEEEAIEEDLGEEDSDEEQARPTLFQRVKRLFGIGREDEDEEEPEEETRRPLDARVSRPAREETRPPVRDNVIRDERMTSRAQQISRQAHREHVVDVRQISECKQLIEYLLQGETVLLCLENMDPKDCGRIVDLLSGAAFALQGRMVKVAHLCYLLAPQSVEVIDEKEKPGVRML